MTVAELVAKLQALPQDMRVLVSGYEMYHDEPNKTSPRIIKVHLTQREAGDPCGQHEECSVGWCLMCEGFYNNDPTKPVEVVVIER